MNMSSKSFVWQLVLLALLCLLLMVIWRMPVLLAGDVYDVFPLLDARNYSATGLFSTTDALGRFLSPSVLPKLGVTSAWDGRLSAVLLGHLSSWLPWNDLVGWTLISAATMAGCVLLWWLAVYRMFDTKIAWLSAILFAFLPVYWREALWLDMYNFALLFLFASICAFVWLQERSRVVAAIVAGVLFGCSVSAKDTFLVFLPWILVGGVWAGRARLKQNVFVAAAFLVFVCGVYMVPYLGDIQEHGYPFNHNLARIWPGEQEIQDNFYLHLYPDPYTYYFDKDYFDQKIVEEMQNLTFLERLQKYKILINFDVGSIGLFTKVANGFWLLWQVVPSVLHQTYLGGAVLWIFIIPGAVYMCRRHRTLFVLLVGLFISSELIIRLVMHYARSHLMDTGWIFALFAAVGVVQVANALSSAKVLSRTVSILLVSGLLVVQLVQANRVLLANQYRNSRISELRSAGIAVSTLPEEAVIASGLSASDGVHVAFLSSKTVAIFAPETMQRLVESNNVNEALTEYEITHILGYSDDLSARIIQKVPSIESVEYVSAPLPPASSFQRFLLHLVR